MTEAETSDPSKASTADRQAIDAFVKALARVMHDMTLYGRQHAVVKQALNQCFTTLNSLLTQCECLDWTWPDYELLINGVAVQQKAGGVVTLVAHLRDLDVRQFAILQGFLVDELENLLVILASPRDELEQLGGFAAVCTALGIQHIEIRKTRMALIDEGQTVTDAGAVVVQTAEEAQRTREELAAAYLAGDGKEGGAEAVQESMNTPDRLADLIVDAATAAAPNDLEGMASQILMSIRRYHEAITSGSLLNTQKGRKQAEKAMLGLGQAIQTRTMDQLSEERQDEVTNAIETAVDEIRIDSLATDYVKRRRALDENEKRVLRFMKYRSGDETATDNLREKMVNSGLNEDEWEELAARCDGALAPRGLNQPGALGNLLEEVKQPSTSGDGGVDSDRMTSLLTEVDREVALLVKATEQRIRDLEAKLKDAQTKPQPPPLQTVLEPLAEIVQELCQPLSVVNCALETVGRKDLGGLTPTQSDVLELAKSNSQRLELLIRRLLSISGLPKSLDPDQSIRELLYHDAQGQP